MAADLDLTRVQAFVDRWAGNSGGERAAKDAFCLDLVAALGLEPPTPGEGGWVGSYGFEIDSLRVGPGGKASLGKIDFLKPDAFLMEAKMGSNAGDAKLCTAKRGTAGWNIAMEGAKGQAMGCASSLPKAVPFLVVCDIGHCFDLYADFSLSSVAIDFFGLEESTAREIAPALFQHLLDHVLPERAMNKRESIRRLWWRHGWERPDLRRASRGAGSFIATARTGKHRVFVRLPEIYLPESEVISIALPDERALAILSSRIHLVWASAAGSKLEDRPRYNNTTCFAAFPFPETPGRADARLLRGGRELEAHRRGRAAQHPDLTINGMYNVLEKLRSGEALAEKDRVIHDKGLVSVLKSIHDELDAAVFEAYGWPVDLTDEQILEKLVALNAERAEEERKGLVRWLRPEFQNPESTKATVQTSLAEEDDGEDEVVAAGPKRPAFPKKLAERIAEVRDLVLRGGDVDAEGVAAGFSGVKAEEVREVLEALAAMGVVVGPEDIGAGGGGGMRWRAVRGAA